MTKPFFSLFLIFALVSCTSQQEVNVAMPTVTTKSTQVITSIASPTQTPSPTLYPLPTVPLATLNAVATLDVIRIDLINKNPDLEKYRTFCYPDDCYGAEISPNGQYIILTNGNEIQLFTVNGQRIGKYSFYEFYNYVYNYGDGNTSVSHWSNDGVYLYISTFYGDGGPEPYFGYKSMLVRVNLKNGTWKDTGISGVISFAPNDRYVIYSTNHGEIRVRDLQSGAENTYLSADDHLYFGHFVWSSESKKIIFVGSPEDWDMPDGKFALYMIDLDKKTISNLYESPFPFYYPISWTEINTVVLNNFRDYGEWTLDLSSTPPKIKP